MGKSLCDAYPDVKERYFDRADEVLGFGISKLCFEGPEEELVKTENQQPAIFLVSCAIGAVLQGAGLQSDAVAGHSLGEYSALVAAEALDFETGLRLTRRRGELMAGIAKQTGGIMAAILGLSAEEIEEACLVAGVEGVVEVANYNSPEQTVISGEEDAVRRAMEEATLRGASRVIELDVSAPFHCRLMRAVGERFKPELDRAEVRDPRIPVVANVSADYERTAAEVRENLVSQLASPVRWTESVQRLISDGHDRFIEVGPGKVLTRLMKAIDPENTAVATNDPTGIERALEAAKGA